MANTQNLKNFTGADDPRRMNGRPKGIPNAKTRYKRLLELTSKKANPVTGELEEFTQLELMDMAVFNKALKGDMIAYKEIMDRLEGKPGQDVKLEHSGSIEKLSLEELNERIDAYRRRHTNGTEGGAEQTGSS